MAFIQEEGQVNRNQVRPIWAGQNNQCEGTKQEVQSNSSQSFTRDLAKNMFELKFSSSELFKYQSEDQRCKNLL